METEIKKVEKQRKVVCLCGVISTFANQLIGCASKDCEIIQERRLSENGQKINLLVVWNPKVAVLKESVKIASIKGVEIIEVDRARAKSDGQAYAAELARSFE